MDQFLLLFCLGFFNEEWKEFYTRKKSSRDWFLSRKLNFYCHINGDKNMRLGGHLMEFTQGYSTLYFENS